MQAMGPLARTAAAASSMAYRSAIAAGPSTATTKSKIIPLIAAQQQQQLHKRTFASSTLRRASPSSDVERLSTTDDVIEGSAKKAAQASPSSLAGGRVGIIAPSQAYTEDWSIQQDYPDYSRGPSALDKASRLFFFSEILRGMWVV